jgi:hypothetical protein
MKFTDLTLMGGLFTISPSPSELISPTTTKQQHSLHHPFYSRLVGPLENETTHLESLAKAALLSPIYICCDGGHDPIRQVASHGWVLADSFGSPLWKGSGPVDGIPSQLNPF